MLSIITINYNNREGLKKTAQSIAEQTCQDYEWIVIDGGSTDGSKDIIDSYSEYISYWVCEKDNGIYHAMNKGIDRSTGNYLQFLNSGDTYYDNNVISDFYKRQNTEDVIYGREIGIDRDGNTVWEWQLPEEPLRLSFFWTKTLKHQATFFSRRCFDRFRYNEEHKINSDVELYMNLLYNNYKFASYDRCIAKFDTSGISSSKSNDKLGAEEFRDTISRLMPPGMVNDYTDLIFCRDVDIISKAKDIANSNKTLRNILRLFIYPIHLFSSKKNTILIEKSRR